MDVSAAVGGGIGVFNDVSYVAANLIPYTDYTFVITPTDASGTTYETQTTTTRTKPRVYNVAATDISYNYIKVAWTGYYNTVSVARNGAIDVSAAVGGGIGIFNDVSYISSGLIPYTNYTFVITPTDASGTTYETQTTTTRTKPRVYAVSATDISYNYIKVAWMGYYNTVSIKKNGAMDVSAAVGGGIGVFNDVSYVSSGLIPYTNYIFVITPTDLSGTTYDTQTISTITSPKINLFEIIDISYTTTRLHWTGYYNTANPYNNSNLVVSSVGNGTGIYNDISYVNTGLSPYTQYSYVVKPTNQTGTEIGTSNTITIKTSPIVYTLTFTNVLTTQTTATLDLNWTGAYPSVNIYQNSVFVIASTGTTLARTGLTAGSTYTYKVVPTDDNSVEYTQITRTVVVPTAANITSANPAPTSIQVVFTAPTVGGTVSQYIAYTSTGIQRTGTASPLTITGLARKTAYTVYVRANFASGYSSISASRNATTK
jgi:hypothetical protein